MKEMIRLEVKGCMQIDDGYTHITSNGLAVDEGRVDTSQDSTGEDIRMYLVCCIPQYATPCSASGDPQVIGSSARCDN